MRNSLSGKALIRDPVMSSRRAVSSRDAPNA
jgi:hypothetical protein